MDRYDRTHSAGLRLLAAQKKQRTNLCVGADVHFNGKDFGPSLYTPFAREEHLQDFRQIINALASTSLFRTTPNWTTSGEPIELAQLMAGITGYFLTAIEAAWEAGIRVFKPQSAFYERFMPYGPMVLHILLDRIHELGRQSGEPYFVILDAKRGDIASTQSPYFATYLTRGDESIAPGLLGQFDFDTMTITTWMGEDVIVPGLPWFQGGKGAIIVTRSSNPSGTALQDVRIQPASDVELSDKQEPFRLTCEMVRQVGDLIGQDPTAAEMMLWLTQRYSEEAELDTDGISPLFSVLGSTVKETGTFRLIRPGGIALVPGFGAQGGNFANAMPILMTEGDFAGQGAIFSSSRGHNYPWMRKYGGNGNPGSLDGAMKRAIRKFRQSERKAYQQAGILCPY